MRAHRGGGQRRRPCFRTDRTQTAAGPAIEIASVDGDTAVNSVDLAIVAASFSQTTGPNLDIDENGIVNGLDLPFIAQSFARFC